MKFKFLTSLVLLAALSAGANAASGERVNATIQVNSSVPSTTFNVAPIGASDFSGIIANLDYETTSGKFSTFDLTIEATYETGFSALLASTPTITNGTDSVTLQVTVDGTTISTTPEELSSGSITSSTTTTHTLAITAPDTASLSSGNYTGSVQIIFEDGV